MTLLDASAVLAWLQGEPGAAPVDEALDSEEVVRVAAPNWLEVLLVARRQGADVHEVEGLLLAAGFTPEALLAEDAAYAATLADARSRLSLADRCCLAVGCRLGRDGEETLTADRSWTASDAPEATLRFLR